MIEMKLNWVSTGAGKPFGERKGYPIRGMAETFRGNILLSPIDYYKVCEQSQLSYSVKSTYQS